MIFDSHSSNMWYGHSVSSHQLWVSLVELQYVFKRNVKIHIIDSRSVDTLFRLPWYTCASLYFYYTTWIAGGSGKMARDWCIWYTRWYQLLNFSLVSQRKCYLERFKVNDRIVNDAVQCRLNGDVMCFIVLQCSGLRISTTLISKVALKRFRCSTGRLWLGEMTAVSYGMLLLCHLGYTK